MREERLRPAVRWRKIAAIAQALAEEWSAREALGAGLSYPIEAYDQFRRDVPLKPPPATTPAPLPRMIVAVDARSAAPFLIRATLRSLQDQSHDDWTARVLVPASICDDPVASFAVTDTRIRFISSEADGGGEPKTTVAIDGGTVLDPEALAWLGFSLARTGARGAFADHDHGIPDPALRLIRTDPMFFGAYDPLLFEEVGAPALIAVVLEDAGSALPFGGEARLAALHAVGRDGSIVSVPRVLATQLGLPLVARGGRREEDDDQPGRLAPALVSSPVPALPPRSDERIAVVIPTRDAPSLLARAVATLRATAGDADRLDIVIVDNRSAEPETFRLFADLEASGTARVVPFDSPFNWSLASNIGAAASTAPLIAFVNNDIEMIAAGWDDLLAAALRCPAVGAVGARLLYPGGTVQHAGMAFGFGPGGAEHEGRGVPMTDPGPGRRYVTSHAVSSVTGAFLGVRRNDFEIVGGFDAARLMIAHSDVDLCLKLRERGLTILYCPRIEAVHHEGATRGVNETCAAVAWDEGERADLLGRWGDALFVDPGISPYWRRGGAPFDLLYEPTIREILAHVDRSASERPWQFVRA